MDDKSTNSKFNPKFSFLTSDEHVLNNNESFEKFAQILANRSLLPVVDLKRKNNSIGYNGPVFTKEKIKVETIVDKEVDNINLEIKSDQNTPKNDEEKSNLPYIKKVKIYF